MSEQDTTTTETTAPAEQGATPADVATVVKQNLEAADQATQNPQEPQADEQGDPAEAALGDAGKRALKAERERAEKAERALSQLQNELQTAREQAAQVPQRVAQTLRDHLVQIHQISDEDAALFLTSDDPETLLKQVTRFVQRTAAVDAAPTTPKPDLSQGGQQAPALNSDALEAALKAKLGIA